MVYDLMANAVPSHATNKNRFKTDCPFCGKEEHFWFDLKTKMGICFKCMDKHIRIDGPQFNLEDLKSTGRDLNDLRASLHDVFNKPTMSSLEGKKGIDLDIFSEPISVRRHPRSVAYLMDERGFTLEDIEKYNVRSGKSYRDEDDRLISKWTGRVVFPFYEDGICVYAIGRTYMRDDKRSKYTNTDVPKSDIVYGINSVKDKECIICEGLLSAMAAEKATGVSSVCLLGKTLSDFQLYKIRKKADRVWLSLDGGVPEKQVKSIARKLIRAGFQEVWRVDLPGEDDPDDLGDEYFNYFTRAKRIRYV
jgi:hypothetical protein